MDKSNPLNVLNATLECQQPMNAVEQLKQYPCWVTWRRVWLNDRWTKIPYNPKTGLKASSTDCSTWATYEQSAQVASKYDGLGFVFCDENPFTGLDLDHCIVDGKIEPWAEEIVKKMNSYTEYSPSKNGLHIIIDGKLGKDTESNRKGQIEVYSRGRYFTFTDNHYVGSPQTIENRQSELNIFHQEIFQMAAVQSTQPIAKVEEGNTGFGGTDDELLQTALTAKNGDKFRRLFYDGDTSDYSDDDSSADLALCNLLAFWCGPDYTRIERLFRQSKLCREKWLTREDYRQRTINAALSQCKAFYSNGCLLEKLNGIRAATLKPFDRRRRMADLILFELKGKGKFIHTKDNQTYYFFDEKHKLYKIDSDDSQFDNLLYEIAGLNKADPDWFYVFNELRNHTQVKGQESCVWQFSRYQDKKLYLSCFDGTSYILDGKEINTGLNGTDGILFLDQPDWQSWKTEPQDEEFTLDKLISQIYFDSSDNPAEGLSLQEYQRLFRTYLYCLYFIDLLPTRPIAAFIGEKGSGKTSIIRRIGKMLFGYCFDVRSLDRDKQDAFIVMISKEIFVGLDNVDTSIPWLNDRLSTLSTGNAVTLRELYTTNSERRIYPRCLVCLSSRTPHFRRDDVADRLLIFKVKRIPPNKNLPERALLKVIEQNRGKLLGELVQQLNKIVEYLNSHDIDNLTCDFRLADFATFGKAVWLALEGQEAADEWEAILQKMKLEQDDFATEDDTLPSVLLGWMGDEDEKGPINPSSLISELRNTACRENIAFDYHDSRALGRRFSNIRSNLEERFGIVIKEKTGHGNVKMRTFIKKGYQNDN